VISEFSQTRPPKGEQACGRNGSAEPSPVETFRGTLLDGPERILDQHSAHHGAVLEVLGQKPIAASLHLQDGADADAGFHVGETFVDLVEGAAVGDEALEVELAGPPQVDHAGHVP
jgi:hypothetical protein